MIGKRERSEKEIIAIEARTLAAALPPNITGNLDYALKDEQESDQEQLVKFRIGKV